MNKVRLKRASGWFAAGRAWQRALGVLSDGGFKVFVYVSLQAERDTRRLSFQQRASAQALGESRRSIQSYLKELVEEGSLPDPLGSQSVYERDAGNLWGVLAFTGLM